MSDSNESECPRCGLVLTWDRVGSLAALQVEACAYCRQNARRLMAGRSALREPTAEFPTATGKGMGDAAIG